MKVKIFIILICFWSFPCMSHSVNLFIGSKHFSDLDQKFNEDNPGFAININRGKMIYGFGTYINSYNKNTVFTHIGIRKRWFNIKTMLVTGYEEDIDCKKSVCPGIAFGVEFNRLNLEYIPGTNANTLAMHLRVLDF